MMTTGFMPAATHPDAELVAESLSGNREAFGRIVERYQSLVCALAYSATGNLSQSEDLAQETFVAAWSQLRNLREPGRLRSWLCGIARNLINNWLRRQGREPSHRAEDLEAAQDALACEPLPPERAISNEEAAILWRALEQVPEVYREPLVLFYREHQSIENVAAALELTEDAVRQRLSRGRKLLHEQVLAFVEGALERTGPGTAFTVAVLAALPALVPQAAAGVAATATKGSALAKSAATAGLAASILGPLIGLMGGAFGAWMSIKNTRSPRERQFMIRMTGWCAGFVALFGLALFGVISLGRPLATTHRTLFFGLIAGLILVYGAVLFGLIFWSNHRQRQIQIEDGTYVEPSARRAKLAGQPTRAAIYGGLGGSILGGTAWLLVAAVRAQDWLGVGAVALVAAAAFVVSAVLCVRKPERYFSVAALVCVGLGVAALALIHLRWAVWFANDPQLKNWSLRSLTGLVALVYGIVAVFLWSKRRSLTGAASAGEVQRSGRPAKRN